jgi:hypothetical protein
LIESPAGAIRNQLIESLDERFEQKFVGLVRKLLGPENVPIKRRIDEGQHPKNARPRYLWTDADDLS